MTQFIESPEFGVDGGWKLLYRVHEDGGVMRETRVLPVRGLGVLMSTTARVDDQVSISNTATVNGVVVVEYLRPVTGEAVRVLHRELMTVSEFASKQPKKNPTKFVAGSVISFNVGNGVGDEEQRQDQEQDQGQVASQQPDGQPSP